MSRRPVIPIREANPADDRDGHHDDDHDSDHDSDGGPTRRAALQWMAASLALASGACTRSDDPRLHAYVTTPEAGRGGLPVHYASAFVDQGYAEGVLVGTREGRPIKIEGNPSHPSSLGSTSVFAQASILGLWDPDRSQVVRQSLAALRADAGDTRGGGAHAAPLAAPSTWLAFETAWQQRATALEARRGAGLAILTGAFTSPSIGAGLGAVLRRFPQARWHRHAPLAATAQRDGARQAFGRACDFVCHFDRARCIVAFAADPFSHVPGHVRHARDWAAQRAGTGAGEAARMREAPRSFAFEVAPGLFGARADERAAMAPAQVEALVEEVAGLVGVGESTTGSPTARRVAAALRRAGAASLIVGGACLSARTHALIAAMNHRLGAFGRTLDAVAPLDDVEGLAAGTLAGLVGAIATGGVDTLLVLGGNPAYDAPADVDFAAALPRVGFSAHLGVAHDETARLATWHLPASHDYESWGDARAHDGTATLLQPVISPLYDTRSPIEWLALLAGSDRRDGHDLVQTTWRARRGEVDDARFTAWWRDALRRGVVTDDRPPSLVLVPLALAAVAPAAAPPLAAPPADGGRDASSAALVAVCAADPSCGTGGGANNGWLQELPRPFTKLTWGNAALLGPRTAASLQLATGDVVRIAAAGKAIGPGSVEAPVWVVAEHAEGVLTLPLGYGRRAAGRVGDGVGFDAYRLRRADDRPLPITLARTDRRHDFAVTQHRFGQEGRDSARSVGRAEALPRSGAEPSLYDRSAATPADAAAHAWAMTIDLDACIGCNACTIACQAENNIPVVGAEQVARGREMHWIRVDRYEASTAGASGGSVFQPVPCMHCEDAPCEVVCPVGATVHDSDGLNVQVYNRCVGTRFCSNNCPYKVRRFNFLQYGDTTTETLKAMRNPEVTVRQRGVMEKCTYCVQRISHARIEADKSGTPIGDGDVVTACQSACPTRAIHFGDLADAGSDVTRSKASPRHYALLEELNTRPRTTYLARVVDAAAEKGAS